MKKKPREELEIFIVYVKKQWDRNECQLSFFYSSNWIPLNFINHRCCAIKFNAIRMFCSFPKFQFICIWFSICVKCTSITIYRTGSNSINSITIHASVIIQFNFFYIATVIKSNDVIDIYLFSFVNDNYMLSNM